MSNLPTTSDQLKQYEQRMIRTHWDDAEEKWYYVNKCVQILSSIGNNLQAAIVPGEEERDYLKRKISATRIYNILSLIVKLYTQIDSATVTKDDKHNGVSISRITSENQYYKGKLTSIKQNVACFLKDYPDIEIT